MNKSSLNERTAFFLTELSVRLYERAYLDIEVFEDHQKDILLSIVKVLFDYNRKMGIPFVTADDSIRTLITNLTNNIKQSYFEAKTLQDLLKKGFFYDISNYLKYRFYSVFLTMDFDARFIH